MVRMNNIETDSVIRTNKMHHADIVLNNKDTREHENPTSEYEINRQGAYKRFKPNYHKTTNANTGSIQQYNDNDETSCACPSFGLSGSNRNFLAEFEVSLKSVLLNAPLHLNLEIHVFCDDAAYKSIPKILQKAKLSKSEWVTSISIHTYNVSPHVSKWKSKISKT